MGVDVAVDTVAGVATRAILRYRGNLARNSSKETSSGGCIIREAAPVDVTNGRAGELALLPATPVGGALIVTVLQRNKKNI